MHGSNQMSKKKAQKHKYRTQISEAGTARKVKKDGNLYPLYGQEKALDNIDLLKEEAKYLTYKQLAGLIRVTPETLKKAMKEFPEVGLAIEEGKALGASEAGKKLYRKAIEEGDTKSLIFYLERYCDRKQGISIEMDDVTDKAYRLQDINDWYSVEYAGKGKNK